MNIWRLGAALLPLLALSACQTAAPPPAPEASYPPGLSDPPLPPPPPPPPPGSVSIERMSEITRVLASDEFQGRSMGTVGEERTVAYLIEQYKAAGLEPGGENGGWAQTVPLIRTQLQQPVMVSVRQAGTTVPLRYPQDIYLSTVRPVESARIANAPMVFVGYGVTAPERGWETSRAST